MKELLNETGVPIKNPGDGLSHKDINSINIAVNNVIEAENFDLINFCNILVLEKNSLQLNQLSFGQYLQYYGFR